MNTKTKNWIFLGLGLVLITFVLISGCIEEEKVGSKENQSLNQSANVTTVTTSKEKPVQESRKGIVVFAIKDVSANMSAISSVNVTIDKVEVHSNKTNGWIAVLNTTKTYNLLELKAKGTTNLISSANLDAGTYDQIRLYIARVVVIDNNVEKEAILPSNKLKIITELVVKENKTSTVIFDFIADKSLHVTGRGKIIMAPVIKVETRTNAAVEIKAKKVKIKGGKIKTNIIVGMDENGNIGKGVRIKPNAQIIIKDDKIKILNVSSKQALNIVHSLSVIPGGKARLKGSIYIVRGIDAETNKTVEIKVNGITGAVIGKYRINVTDCEEECKTNCETKYLADCKDRCKTNTFIKCKSKAYTNCSARCNSFTASCEERCKNEVKTECSHKCNDLLNRAECKAKCEAEAMISCKAKCETTNIAGCKAECKSKADAECAANLDLCNKQCLMDVRFKECYSNCTKKC